ncbi:EAL domain-containing protein [Massilia niabensis]|uniref:EAL domain-containing protein n=1 Tax=Massilia niabensis TaxID=544910 RepID=A0ABW0L7L4_9BURK
MSKYAVPASPLTSRLFPLVWLLLALLCCALLWGITLMRTEAETTRAAEVALRQADAYADAYEQYLTRSIAQMDQVTMQLKHSWERARRPGLLEDMRAAGMFTDSTFISVSVIDVHGRVRSATHPLADGPDLSQLPFFVQHRNNNSTALRIDAAPPGLRDGRPAILFTRRLDRLDDEFDGVVVMLVDAQYFTSFAGPAALGRDGVLALLGPEGILRIEQHGAGAARALLPGTAMQWFDRPQARLVEGQGGFADGVARMVGWRRSSAYPVLALVALSQREALAGARQYAQDIRDNAILATIGVGMLALLAGVLSLRAAARAREEDEVRLAYRTATESANDGFYMASPVHDRKGDIVDFTIVDCNERGAWFYGMTRAELVGRRVSNLDSGVHGLELIGSYQAAMANGYHEEDRRMPVDARLNIAWGRRRLIRVGNGLAITLQDISERKAHEEQMQRLANEDPLTGLPNRHWLLHTVPPVLARAASDGEQLALLFIDLDEFKHVNDSHGHAAGDRLLHAASRRLLSLLRPNDRVARFGGDEFVVLLGPAGDEWQVADVAERIVAAFRAPFALGDELQAAVGASIGISIFPRDGLDLHALIRHADIAMYASKNDGRGQHRFYDQALSATVKGRAQLKARLLEALERGQFLLHYQPRVDTVSGALLSMEALLRWQQPEAGMIAPNEFIPLAESSGLILPIGERVIDMACAQLARWRAAALPLVPVSINVSVKQFASGRVLRQFEEAMRRHNVPASLLEIEVTESVMMGDHDEIAAELAAIRARGIKLHVDDFGTGYSSLSQLQRLRMDVLKVDRAFTAELGGPGQGRVFFQAIVSMAHALGMAVVAEGVETEAQLAILRELGCDEVQGYLISKPLPPDAMAGRFLTHRTLDALHA